VRVIRRCAISSHPRIGLASMVTRWSRLILGWVTDYLRTGKLSRHVTIHPGRLSQWRRTVQCAVIGCKLKQHANEGCNSCVSLAGLVLSFIACFILLVIAALAEFAFSVCFPVGTAPFCHPSLYSLSPIWSRRHNTRTNDETYWLVHLDLARVVWATIQWRRSARR